MRLQIKIILSRSSGVTRHILFARLKFRRRHLYEPEGTPEVSGKRTHSGLHAILYIAVTSFLSTLSLVASLPKLELRDFHTVQGDLESVLLKLKSSFNPEVRRSLLRELRILLEQADRLLGFE